MSGLPPLPDGVVEIAPPNRQGGDGGGLPPLPDGVVEISPPSPYVQAHDALQDQYAPDMDPEQAQNMRTQMSYLRGMEGKRDFYQNVVPKYQVEDSIRRKQEAAMQEAQMFGDTTRAAEIGRAIQGGGVDEASMYRGRSGLSEAPGRLASGLVNSIILEPAKGMAGVIGDVSGTVLGEDSAIASGLSNARENIRGAQTGLDQAMGLGPDVGLGGKIAGGLGSAIGFAGSALAGGSAIAPAVMGSLGGLGEAYDTVDRTGAEGLSRFTMAVTHGALGAAEALPFINFLNRATGGQGGRLAKEVGVRWLSHLGTSQASQMTGKVLAGALEQGVEEMLQEMGSQALKDLVADELLGLEERKTLETISEDGLVGFIVGALMGGASGGVNAARGERINQDAEPAASVDQNKEFDEARAHYAQQQEQELVGSDLNEEQFNRAVQIAQKEIESQRARGVEPDNVAVMQSAMQAVRSRPTPTVEYGKGVTEGETVKTAGPEFVVDDDVSQAISLASSNSGGTVDAVDNDQATEAEKEAIEFARSRGAKVQLVDSENFRGGRIGDVILVEKGQEDNALFETIGHEVTHTTGLDLSDKIADREVLRQAEQRYVANYERAFGEEAARQLQEDPARLKREATAQLVGEVIKDPAVRKRIQEVNPSLWTRIKDGVAEVTSKFTGKSDHVRKIIAEFREGQAAPRKLAEATAGKESRESQDLFTHSLQGSLTEAQKARIGDPEKLVEEIVQSRRRGVTNRDAINRLVASQMGLIKQHAARLAGEGADVSKEDIVNAGIQGMISMAEQPLSKGIDAGKLPLEAYNKGKGALSTFLFGRNSRVWTEMQKAAFPTRGRKKTKGAKHTKPELSVEQHAEATETPASELAGAVEDDYQKRLGQDFEKEGYERSQLDLANELMKMVQAGKGEVEIRKALADKGIEVDAKQLGQIVSAAKDASIEFAPGRKTGLSSADIAKRKAMLIQALGESPKTIGRPELANISDKEEVRRMVDVEDEIRKTSNIPGTRPDAVVKAEADAILADSNRRDDVMKRAKAGEMLGDAELQALRRHASDIAFKAFQSQKDADISEAVALIQARREIGTEWGRLGRQLQDPFKSPKDRMAEYAIDAVLSAPKAIRKELKKLDEQAQDVRREMRKLEDNESPSDGETYQLDLYKQKLDQLLEKKNKALKKWVLEQKKFYKELKDLGFDLEALQKEGLEYVVAIRIVRAAQAYKAEFGDKLYEYWINGILSAPGTQAVNAIGTIAKAGQEYLFNRPIEATINLVTGSKIENAPTFGEMRSMGRGLKHAMKNAMHHAMVAWQSEHSSFEIEHGELAVDKDKLDLEVPVAIKGRLGKAVRTGWFPLNPLIFGGLGFAAAGPMGAVTAATLGAIPGGTRTIRVVDEFFKGFFGTVEAYAYAHRRAKAALEAGKIDKGEFDAEVDKMLNKPGSAAWMHGIEEAQRLTFQTDLGAVGKAILEGRRKWHEAMKNMPLFDLQYTIPFVTTLANIFKQGFRVTPLASPKFVYDMAKHGYEGMAGKAKTLEEREVLRRVGEQVLGYMLLTAVWHFTDDDEDGLPYITGAQAREDLPLGYRTVPAYNIKIPGTDTYWNYGRVEPLATTLAALVDGVKFLKDSIGGKKDIGESGGEYFRKLGTMLQDKNFAKGLKRVLDSFDSDSSAAYWLTDFASSWSPNATRGMSRSLDDYIRETRVSDSRPWESMKQRAKMLGYKFLPLPNFAPHPKVDIYGRDVERTSVGGQLGVVEKVISPAKRKPIKDIAEWDKMVVKWNRNNPDNKVLIGDMQPYLTLSVAGNKKRLNLSQKDQYEMKKMAGAYITEILSDVEFDTKNPTPDNIMVYKKVIRLVRERTRKVMLAKMFDAEDPQAMELVGEKAELVSPESE